MFIYWVPSATDLAVLISLDSVSEVPGSFIFLVVPSGFLDVFYH